MLTNARFFEFAGTESGQSLSERDLNMLVMYGIRHGMQLAGYESAGLLHQVRVGVGILLVALF